MGLMSALDQAVHLELRVAECYKRLSALAESDSLRKELLDLAGEEVGHANLLRTGKNYLAKEPDLFCLEEKAEAGLGVCLGFVDELLNGLDRKALSLADGLRKARALEVHCEKAHLTNLVEIRDESLKKLFEALSKSDEEHVKRIDEILMRPLSGSGRDG